MGRSLGGWKSVGYGEKFKRVEFGEWSSVGCV